MTLLLLCLTFFVFEEFKVICNVDLWSFSKFLCVPICVCVNFVSSGGWQCLWQNGPDFELHYSLSGLCPPQPKDISN